MILLVDRYEHLCEMLATSLLEVSSTNNIAAGGPAARHIDIPSECAWYRYQCSLLTVTPRGNTYILLFTDRFSRRADMFAVTAAKFTAAGTANTLINRYIPRQRCPRSTHTRTTALTFDQSSRSRLSVARGTKYCQPPSTALIATPG